ncbi:MAG: hypothetical protein K2Q03_06900 [Sphingobacteriaceae bacterium]|nr:hypothetical protein [Sphingobacteriaceae bacterium]
MIRLLTTYYYVFLEHHDRISRKRKNPYDAWFPALIIVTLSLLMTLFGICIAIENLLKVSLFKISKFGNYFVLGLIFYLLYYVLIKKNPNNKVFSEKVKQELDITTKTRIIAYSVFVLSFLFPCFILWLKTFTSGKPIPWHN